jgi:hypothetical protein
MPLLPLCRRMIIHRALIASGRLEVGES